ncbi:hypothetical protein L5515_004132 [Caenorhabditis briggsae]|uniref:Structural maintenance of chromosomes protein 4 n=1 Tax=Caenorhabditis briggsae TaxID=6238 RepID=A0AAE9JAM4_CAEBR|nr:hypothetical protein L5515_004132 [Caenorhabditis briggsae]
MPPKKSTEPPPQSDESASDFEDEPERKKQKKTKKTTSQKRGNAQKEGTPDQEAELKKAADQIFDGSDGEDDDTDLFALTIPPKPDFLIKTTKKDRLMIMNVEVNNFKSYYGKASIGPFHKSFTSIIGPNGSGKSNLIDSLLFVFGFRASKIRSAKVANLIHKSNGRNPDSCTVTIHFQRINDVPGHYEIVKDSGFQISRTAYKNSSSSYAINGRAASRADVEAHLRQADIDIEHNRFLILQGEVEQIAMMKPVKQTKSETGMVEYLEDIVGSNRLEPFVKRFQRRVNRINCDLTQQRITRDHARNSKIAMEGQVRAAIEFLKKENEATLIEMKLDQRRRKLYLDKVAPKQAELDKKEEELNSVAEKIASNKTEATIMEDEEKKMKKEGSKIDKEIDRLTKDYDDLTAEEKRRKETIKRYETDLSKTEAELEKEEKKKQTLIAVPEKAEKKIKKWKEELEQLKEIEKTANEEASKNLDEFEKRTDKLKEDQKRIQETWNECNTEAINVRREATLARSDFEDMKTAATSGSRKLEKLKEQLQASEEKYNEDKAELEKLKPAVGTLRERKNDLETKLPGVRNDYRQTNVKISQINSQLEGIRQQNAASVGSSQVMKAIAREREAGRLKSFVGRVGELAFIDKKYEAAICTNYGAVLKQLVCRDESDSARIIDIANSEKLGRQYVVSLDRYKFCDMNLLTPVPPGTNPGPRLIDLIECDNPEIKAIIFKEIRDVLVAKDTKEAIEMNKTSGKAVCTLQGSLVSVTGNITGGGSPRYGDIETDKSKKPKQVTPQDKDLEKKLTEEVTQLKQKSDSLRQEEQKLDSELTRIRHEVAQSSKRLDTLTGSVDAEGTTVENLKKAIQAQEKEVTKVKVDEKDIETKQKAVEEVEKKSNELKEKSAGYKEQQAQIQSKLDDIFKELVGCHRDEAKDASQKCQKIEKDTAKEQASVANSARNIAKCDENIARLTKDKEKKTRMCDELKEKAIDEEGLATKKSDIDELSKKRKEWEEKYNELTKKQSALSEDETKLSLELKVLEEAMKELKDSLAGYAAKTNEIEKRLSGLQINRIPRFQFLIESSRPEDLTMQVDDLPVDENQSPEEAERHRKHIASAISDRAYALEYGLRRKGEEDTEEYENVDVDTKIPVELLAPEQVDEITDHDAKQLQHNLQQCKLALETAKQNVDLSCIATYVIKVNQFNEEVVKLAEVNANFRRHNERLQKLKKDRLEEFHSAFEFIGKHLVAVYKMLTDGGDAKLEYIDKDDPFKEGISFMVRPAKKAWKQIQYLSGGEKTLSSLALIFALHMFRPTPFYVMDEIDAALDYRNVSIIAQYVRQKTENAQFIIISLRNNMFELANRLVGIYKVDGCTKNVAIDPQSVCELAKSISASLGQITCTLPEEVTERFNETVSRQHKEITAQEKQYVNFPSSNEISKAEKIVSVEGRVRKEMNHTTRETPEPSTSQSRTTAEDNATERAVSTRPGSRAIHMKIPNPRLVERSSSASTRSPKRERNTGPDGASPPTKKSNTTNSSPKTLSPKTTGPSNDNKPVDDDEYDFED